MRPTRRQESIFSVSAVDLFASALGAFLIVALVLFPYFPNTTDTPPATTPGLSAADVAALEAELAALQARISELEEQLAEARQQAASAAADDARITALERELDDARQRERELEQQLEAATTTVKKLPPLDLVIALDTTNSMANEIAGLREEIAGLAELLSHMTDDAAVGLIDFKDRCQLVNAVRVAQLRPVNPQTAAELAAFARTMFPGTQCNLTVDEDYAEALRTAVGMNWRSTSERRSIVLISDNPAHDDMRAQAVADARAFAGRPGARHTVSSIFVDTAPNPRHPDTEAFMRQVATAGNGTFVQADQNASLSVTILLAVFQS